MTKAKDVRAELTKEQLKLVVSTLDAACKMLLALKPILDGLIKEADRK